MEKDRYGRDWSRDELVLALYLYCQLPFAKTKANNPEVAKLAKMIGRTPASVARKLGNFGAFDPYLASRGISGLVHASRADRAIWEEFNRRWDALVKESKDLLIRFNAPSQADATAMEERVVEDEKIISRPTGPSERTALVSVRLFQAFFRRAVLASYDSSCCVCGLDIRSLLIASHIKPWSLDKGNRAAPENGLCLCGIHDRAFDRGIISVSNNLQVIVASSAMESKQSFVRTSLSDFKGKPIQMPRRFAPSMEHLAWHRENVFES